MRTDEGHYYSGLWDFTSQILQRRAEGCRQTIAHVLMEGSYDRLGKSNLGALQHPDNEMSAAYDFSALSPPFLRNMVDTHIFPPIPEWTDSSLSRAEQLYAKYLGQVRDTLKDSDKQSSHVISCTVHLLIIP
jgi:hypothetical protein